MEVSPSQAMRTRSQKLPMGVRRPAPVPPEAKPSDAALVLRVVRDELDVRAGEPAVGPSAQERAVTLDRVINAVLATISMILLAPLFVAVAVAIKLTSRGPIFYTQARVGVDPRTSRRSPRHDRRGRDLGGAVSRSTSSGRVRRCGVEIGRRLGDQGRSAHHPLAGSSEEPPRRAPALINVIRGDEHVDPAERPSYSRGCAKTSLIIRFASVRSPASPDGHRSTSPTTRPRRCGAKLRSTSSTSSGKVSPRSPHHGEDRAGHAVPQGSGARLPRRRRSLVRRSVSSVPTWRWLTSQTCRHASSPAARTPAQPGNAKAWAPCATTPAHSDHAEPCSRRRAASTTAIGPLRLTRASPMTAPEAPDTRASVRVVTIRNQEHPVTKRIHQVSLEPSAPAHAPIVRTFRRNSDSMMTCAVRCLRVIDGHGPVTASRTRSAEPNRGSGAQESTT